MSNERAHALVLAETLMNISNGRSPQSESFNAAAATELQTQHFRIKELEAMLDAVGAGGVSAQRVTQAADHIAQDRKMVASQETNNLLARIEKEISTAQINNHRMAAPFGKMEGEPCVRISSLLATIEGFFNEVNGRRAAAQEPFGYFKAEPFGWRDCAETDEGAIALYEAPQPQADARDAQRYRWLRAQPLESDSSMFCTTIWRKGSDGFGDDLRLEKLDDAIDAAIASSKEKAK